METGIYKLLYVSTASKGLDEEELLQILKQARRNNEANGITGLLLYADRSIIQMLEGNKAQVDATFKSISADLRHTGIIKLIGEFADERDFSEWSMGFQRVDAKSLEDIDGFNDLLGNKAPGAVAFTAISDKVRILLETFKKTARI